MYQAAKYLVHVVSATLRADLLRIISCQRIDDHDEDFIFIFGSKPEVYYKEDDCLLVFVTFYKASKNTGSY